MNQPIIKQLEDFKEGDYIRGKFAVRNKETPREYKNKPGRYFFLGVGDKTGEISLKYWGGPEDKSLMALYNSLEVGDVIEVTGEVAMDKYDNVLTLSMDEGIHVLRKCSEDEYEPKDFLPLSDRNLDDMMEEMHALISSVSETNLRALLESYFSEESFAQAFKESPAAMKHHHSYLGGLLEHTLNVAKLCEIVSNNYPGLNRDLLLTAAILHDVGKISVYKAITSIDMTDQGKFLGHITLGSAILEERLKGIASFPDVLKMKLKHVILSHHGNVESGYQTPKGLKIPEAGVLYYADLLDAKVKDYLQEMEKEKNVEDDWVYLRGVGNEVYMK
ncbi:MAG: HD domain-containing protein [Methanomassiliicoccales archaeon]|nr:MAG: HD domain-containing protein [Methanomassiliicoccales archaeon]